MGKIRNTRRLLSDLTGFAKQRKAYWIVPLVLVLGIAAVLVAVSQSAAPFVYTLF